MERGRRGPSRGALLAAALAATSGCYYLMPPPRPAPAYAPVQPYAPPLQPYAPPPQPYQQPPQAYEQPPQPPQPAQTYQRPPRAYERPPQAYPPGAEAVMPPQPQIGMGLSAGYMLGYGGTGLLIDLEATVWLNEVLGIEVDVGHAKLSDYGYASETVTLIYISVVAVMPQGYGRLRHGGASCYRMGIGYGAVALEGRDAVSIVVLQFGYDWLMPQGGRVFSVCDIMIGQEDVVDEYGYVDPFFALTFRIGMEWRL